MARWTRKRPLSKTLTDLCLPLAQVDHSAFGMGSNLRLSFSKMRERDLNYECQGDVTASYHVGQGRDEAIYCFSGPQFHRALEICCDRLLSTRCESCECVESQQATA